MEKVLENYGPYLTHLEQLAHTDWQLKKCEKIKGFVNKWKDAEYLKHIAIFIDISPMRQLSPSLQCDKHDPRLFVLVQYRTFALKLNKGFLRLWSLLHFQTFHRLRQMKNKGMQQSHALSQNSEPIDMWKVAHHPPSRCAMIIPFRTLQFSFFYNEKYKLNKLKLKQASKEF